MGSSDWSVWLKCHPVICTIHRRLHFYFDPEKLWRPTLQTPYISPNLLAKYSSLAFLLFPLCLYHIVGICGTFWHNLASSKPVSAIFLMNGVLPGGVFVGALLTPPRGVVKSTWGNHQFTHDDETMHIAWCCLWERFATVFQGHPSNFKVTRLEKSSNLTTLGVSGL